jgi:transposase
MPAPLNVDLRQRAVDAFVIGTASLKRWVRSWRLQQTVEPKPAKGGRPPKLDARCEDVLRTLVEEQPDAFCWELAERLEERTGVKVDEDTVGRALTRLGITRKKRRSKPQSRPART